MLQKRDLYLGQDQNVIGIDGIGDTAYIIPSLGNNDNYPFVNPNGWLTIPEIDIEELEDTVLSMSLPFGLTWSLTIKLSNALYCFELGLLNDTINILYAFINQVEAQSGKKISEEQADYLVAKTLEIIESI